MINKLFCIIIFGLLSTIICQPAYAYRLPACQITNEERGKNTEDVLSGYKTELEDLATFVNIRRLDEHRRNPKIRLTTKEQAAAKRYDELLVKIKFWNDVSNLKVSLISLHTNNPPTAVIGEADRIAKDVIETLYKLSQEWKVDSALLTNLLIHMGLEEKGFCYHYVANLRNVLLKQNWSQFDIRWGTSRESRYRENNALVITAKDKPFEDGLAIDAWRTGGRPFWTSVKGDRFPWKEEFDVEEKYEVE